MANDLDDDFSCLLTDKTKLSLLCTAPVGDKPRWIDWTRYCTVSAENHRYRPIEVTFRFI